MCYSNACPSRTPQNIAFCGRDRTCGNRAHEIACLPQTCEFAGIPVLSGRKRAAAKASFPPDKRDRMRPSQGSEPPCLSGQTAAQISGTSPRVGWKGKIRNFAGGFPLHAKKLQNLRRRGGKNAESAWGFQTAHTARVRRQNRWDFRGMTPVREAQQAPRRSHLSRCKRPSPPTAARTGGLEPV